MALHSFWEMDKGVAGNTIGEQGSGVRKVVLETDSPPWKGLETIPNHFDMWELSQTHGLSIGSLDTMFFKNRFYFANGFQQAQGIWVGLRRAGRTKTKSKRKSFLSTVDHEDLPASFRFDDAPRDSDDVAEPDRLHFDFGNDDDDDADDGRNDHHHDEAAANERQSPLEITPEMEADAWGDYGQEDAYIVDTNKEVFISGPHHTLHNMTGGLPETLPLWTWFIVLLKNVTKLLSEKFTRNRLLMHCFSHGPQMLYSAKIAKFNARVYDARWGTCYSATYQLLDIWTPLHMGWNKVLCLVHGLLLSARSAWLVDFPVRFSSEWSIAAVHS
jgi:hypothetical protein